MAVAANDILEIKVYSTQQQQGAINVIHAKVLGTSGASRTESQIAAAIAPVFGPLWKPLMAGASSWRGVGVRVIWPVLTLEYFSILAQGVGTGAGDPLPKQVAGILSLRTNLPGRAYRGRLYMPFPSEGLNDTDSTPTAAYLTAMGLVGTELTTGRTITSGADSVTLGYGVYHRAGHTLDLWVQSLTQDRWGTQMRRGDYGKTNILPI